MERQKRRVLSFPGMFTPKSMMGTCGPQNLKPVSDVYVAMLAAKCGWHGLHGYGCRDDTLTSVGKSGTPRICLVRGPSHVPPEVPRLPSVLSGPLAHFAALGLVFLSMPAIRHVLLRSQAANPLNAFALRQASISNSSVTYKRVFTQGSMVYGTEKKGHNCHSYM